MPECRAVKVISVLLLGFLVTATSPAARKLEPPSQMLRRPHNQVAIVEASRRIAAERFALAKKAELFGVSAERFVVRLEPRTADSLVVGRQYVIGYTSWRKARFPGKSGKDPRGPRLVRLLAVGEAVSSAAPEVVRLLQGVDEGTQEMPPGELLALLIRGLQSKDLRSQRLFAVELFTRRSVHSGVTATQLELLSKIARGPNADSGARQYLLLGAPMFSAHDRPGWQQATVREILRQTSTRLDLYSPTPSLVHTALLLLGPTASEQEFALASRWLTSNSTGIVDAALELLTGLNRARTIGRAERALADPSLPGPTRELIGEYLRLARLQDAQTANAQNKIGDLGREGEAATP
jgi:hypothetical protein